VAYQQKLKIEQNLLDLLQKEVIDTIADFSKKQASEFNILASERKQLEKEHKQLFERMEISQKNYFLHGRERDAVALEKECLALHKKSSEQRQKKVTEK